MLNIDADICLHWGKTGVGVLDAAPSAVFVKTQCFRAPLILLPLNHSHVLTLYGDILFLCISSKEDVPVLKPIFIAC